MSNSSKITVHDSQPENFNIDPFENFRQLLKKTETFPTFYTFKLIVKSQEDKSEEIKAVFNHPSAKISVSNTSTKGNYKSIAVQVFVQDEEKIIDYYKQIAKIDSLMVL